MIRRAIQHLREAHDSFRQTQQIYMVLVAVLIGLLGGLAAVGFRLLIRILNQGFWHQGQYSLDYIAGLSPWWKIAAPAVGGLIVGFITHYFAREARGHGVPEVMEAVALQGGRIRPRVVVAKMIASGVSIGSGGSVGREGPIVQVGSALGSTIGQWLKIDERRLRTLVGCGAAAGIAATFNAPVAGALFAVEVILGDFGVAQFSPIVISSVSGTVVSQYFLGDFPAFQVPGYSLVHINELFAYAGLGLLAGVVAVAFIRMLYGFEDLFDRIKIYPPLKGLLGGAVIGLIGIWLPQIFGVGFEPINGALNGSIVWQLMVLLVAFKILAVSLTIGSGGSGGILSPSLFIGAMLGGAMGTVVHATWPLATATPGAYALVGMGAMLAGATHAPITAILIIFELTNDYKIILPLMISCIIATLLATRLQRASIYTLKLLRRGIDVGRARAINLLQPVAVRDVMLFDMVAIRAGDGLESIIAKFIDHPVGTLFVTDEDNNLEGVIPPDTILPVMAEAELLNQLVIAEDLMERGAFPWVSPGDSLADVIKLLGTYRGEVPVLEDGRLTGVVRPKDVIERYNAEVFKRDMVPGMVSALETASGSTAMPTLDHAVVATVPVSAHFVGRTIRDLQVRTRFGVSVLLVRRTMDDGREQVVTVPEPDYTFQHGDVMLVLGPREQLGRLKRGVSPGSSRLQNATTSPTAHGA